MSLGIFPGAVSWDGWEDFGQVDPPGDGFWADLAPLGMKLGRNAPVRGASVRCTPTVSILSLRR
jgi:hypothetical protein